MNAVFRSGATLVFVALVLLTVLPWYLAEDYGIGRAQALRAVTAALFVVAFFKVRLVIMHFMEIAEAPLPLRTLFEAWVVVVCGVLVVLYLATPAGS